ncbi:MAG TPA: ATP-binding protein [Steroidobacteraceae bacterium]|nr:ATP-binding protein [Steroidobacteraceae bacterium]
MNAPTQCRLLIVDDEVAQMKALCNTLEMEGYATTGYSSARQALASLREGEVDLLLTDLMMPEMDGISLLKAAREVDGNLAGIVMTGQGTIDTAVRAMQHGALDYILKPFKLSTVLTVLARAREVRQLRLDNAALQERERGYIAELEAANKDLEAFSCSVSHDLRAPLRAITGFCDMYLTDYGQDVPPAGRKLLDRVVDGAARMDRLIEDLLSFCRYSRQPLLKGPVKLDVIARKVVEELQLREAGRAVEWRVGALPECNGDASLLQQVLTNLLDNAVKFSPAGEEVRVSVFQQDSRVRIEVSDRGPGVPPDQQRLIFEKFGRGNIAGSPGTPGTGLGLYIARSIVEAHGGVLEVSSGPDPGATFTLSLPVDSAR